jgi:hypothetical protein
LAEFELHGLLGAGGFGLVYRAYDHSLHRTVAVKEYLPASLASRVGRAVAPRSGAEVRMFHAGLRAFMDEARLLAQFDHPSLAKVLRVWEHNATAYMAMPLYQGMTLMQACALMRTPPPEAWLRKLLWSVLQALELLHRRHTVHRDISPDNIFLQDIGPPVLLDLGAARQALDGEQRHPAVLKVNYAPVEQYADARGMRQGPWSDVYALAAVVYGCLSQEPPLPATMRAQRDGMLPPAALVARLHAAHGQHYTPAFVDGLTAALAVEPARRPQDLAAFGALLQLQPVPGMDRFNWRAEMGADWQPLRRPSGLDRQHAPTLLQQPGARVAAVDAGADAGAVAEVAAEVAAAGAQASMRTSGPADAGSPTAVQVGAPRGPRAWWTHVAVGVLVVGLLAAVGMVASPGDVPATAAVPATRPVPVPPPVPVPVPVPVRAEAAVPPPQPALEMPAPAVPRVDVRRAPPRALSAEQICPDSTFLTRPMCLFRACQRSAYAAMPVCMENARQLRESEHRHGP